MLNWQHCTHLYYSPLSLSDVHTPTGISGPRPIRGGVCPSPSLIGLDHDMGLICVCSWTTGRLSESQRPFLFLNGWSHHWEIRSHVRSNWSHSRALMCSQIFQVNILCSADNMFGNPCSRITLPNTLLNKLKSAFINIRKKFNIFNGLPATRSKQHHWTLTGSSLSLKSSSKKQSFSEFNVYQLHSLSRLYQKNMKRTKLEMLIILIIWYLFYHNMPYASLNNQENSYIKIFFTNEDKRNRNKCKNKAFWK